MSQASSVISAFVSALSRQDRAAARELMADGAPMKFPGGAVFTDVGSFIEWARSRYRTADYRYDSMEELSVGGDTVVYARGVIEGELNDGAVFSGVRVVDRFKIRDGKIVEKEAWSDMADYLRRQGL
jgi:hypothetical protein